jgi:hypothetical protein
MDLRNGLPYLGQMPGKTSRSATEPDGGGHPRSADPMAKVMFELLREQPIADRQHVLMALRAQLTERAPERVQLCLTALRTCHAELGHLSRGAYNDWRQTKAMPAEWPSSQMIANTFGSWARASEAVGQNCIADVMARRLVENGRALTREEVLAGIELYAETGGPLKQKSYFTWAKREMQRPDRQIDRLARSAASIIRLFGSWSALLFEAGLAGRLADERALGHEPCGAAADYSRERTIAFLIEAAPSCNGRLMSMKQFDRWAADRSREALENGERLMVPRSRSILRFFATWPDALATAGVISEAEAVERRGRRGHFKSKEYLLEHLAQAVEDLGADLTQSKYLEWRRLQTLNGAADAPIPCADTIAKRFGEWAKAVEAAGCAPPEVLASSQPISGPATSIQLAETRAALAAPGDDRPEHPARQLGCHHADVQEEVGA